MSAKKSCATCGLVPPSADGAIKKLWACSRCKSVSYCTKVCQQNHWPVHKPDCITPIAAASTASTTAATASTAAVATAATATVAASAPYQWSGVAPATAVDTKAVVPASRSSGGSSAGADAVFAGLPRESSDQRCSLAHHMPIPPPADADEPLRLADRDRLITALRHNYDTLKGGSECVNGVSVFGACGVGKTTFVRSVVRQLKLQFADRFGVSPAIEHRCNPVTASASVTASATPGSGLPSIDAHTIMLDIVNACAPPNSTPLHLLEPALSAAQLKQRYYSLFWHNRPIVVIDLPAATAPVSEEQQQMDDIELAQLLPRPYPATEGADGCGLVLFISNSYSRSQRVLTRHPRVLGVKLEPILLDSASAMTLAPTPGADAACQLLLQRTINQIHARKTPNSVAAASGSDSKPAPAPAAVIELDQARRLSVACGGLPGAIRVVAGALALALAAANSSSSDEKSSLKTVTPPPISVAALTDTFCKAKPTAAAAIASASESSSAAAPPPAVDDVMPVLESAWTLLSDAAATSRAAADVLPQLAAFAGTSFTANLFHSVIANGSAQTETDALIDVLVSGGWVQPLVAPASAQPQFVVPGLVRRFVSLLFTTKLNESQRNRVSAAKQLWRKLQVKSLQAACQHTDSHSLSSALSSIYDPVQFAIRAAIVRTGSGAGGADSLLRALSEIWTQFPVSFGRIVAARWPLTFTLRWFKSIVDSSSPLAETAAAAATAAAGAAAGDAKSAAPAAVAVPPASGTPALLSGRALVIAKIILAQSYTRAAQSQRAVDLYETLKVSDEPEWMAAIWYEIGTVLFRQKNDRSNALVCVEKSEKLYAKLLDASTSEAAPDSKANSKAAKRSTAHLSIGLIRTLHSIGTVHSSNRQFQPALLYFDRARGAAEAIGHSTLLAAANHDIGMTLLALAATTQPSANGASTGAAALTERAIAAFDTAQRLRLDAGELLDRVTSLNQMAGVLQRNPAAGTGGRDRALAILRESLSIAESLAVSSLVCSTQFLIGSLYHHSFGDLPAALSWYERSRDGLVRAASGNSHDSAAATGGGATVHAGARELVLVLNAIASVHHSRKSNEAAVESWVQSLAICEKLGDEPTATRTRNSLGIAHYAMKQYPQALNYLLKNQAILKRLASSADGSAAAMHENARISTTLNIGSIYAATRDYAAAIECFTACRDHYQRTNQPTQLSAVLAELGDALRAAKKYSEASDAFNKAANVAAMIGNSEHHRLMKREVEATQQLIKSAAAAAPATITATAATPDSKS